MTIDRLPLWLDQMHEAASQALAYVEGMDKLRPGTAATINWRAAHAAVRTVAAGYQQGGGAP